MINYKMYIPCFARLAEGLPAVRGLDAADAAIELGLPRLARWLQVLFFRLGFFSF